MLTFARKSLPCAALLLLVSFAANLPAQTNATKRNPRIDSVLEDLGKVRALHQTAISPDGSTLAWVVAGEKDGKHSGTEIEIASLATPAKTTRVTAGEKGALCNEGDIAWSPDSKTLAFLSDCQSSDRSQRDFYLYESGTKAAPRRLTHLKGIADEPAFSPDGKQLAFLYVEGATREASPLAAEKPPAGVIGEDGLEIKRVASAGTAPSVPSTIWFLTPPELYIYEFDWSPDANKLTYVAAAPPGENNWWVAKLYIQNAPPAPWQATGQPCPPGGCYQPSAILDPANNPGPLHGLQIAVPRWSPDGTQIAFIGGLMSDQGSTGGDIYTVPAAGGTPTDVTPNRKASPAWFNWVDNNTLGIAEVAGGSAHLFAYTISTAADSDEYSLTIPESPGSGLLSMSVSVAANNDIALIRSSFDHAPEVWSGPLMQLKQITHYNDALKPAWGKAESITWTSAVQPSPTIPPGSEPKDFNVQGWLLYPANYDPAKKYPLITFVHGGPSAADMPRWPSVGFGPAPFAALGYFVLMPNPRGSYGQGEAFTAANKKDFGYGDLRDILAGVDAVTKSHNIDPERVGLTGWSYGGFMTMFAVTQTNRFRAAVAGAGISNWQSYYGQNSIDQWMTPFMGASVYDDPAVYARISAVNYIHNVKTPTLSVVGDRDGECPSPQSFEFWHALKAQHVPTQLVVYPDEGHHFVNPEHQRDVIARALAWFQQYMPAQ